jgi:hypothetical protein
MKQRHVDEDTLFVCLFYYKIPVKALVTVDPYTDDVSIGQLCGTSRTTDKITFLTL